MAMFCRERITPIYLYRSLIFTHKGTNQIYDMFADSQSCQVWSAKISLWTSSLSIRILIIKMILIVFIIIFLIMKILIRILSCEPILWMSFTNPLFPVILFHIDVFSILILDFTIVYLRSLEIIITSIFLRRNWWRSFFQRHIIQSKIW